MIVVLATEVTVALTRDDSSTGHRDNSTASPIGDSGTGYRGDSDTGHKHVIVLCVIVFGQYKYHLCGQYYYHLWGLHYNSCGHRGEARCNE